MTGTVTQSGTLVLVVAVFLASTVEMVEALTIVLAVGVTRGWKSALLGVGAAVLTLAVIVIAVGPALITFVPLNTLRSVIGVLLLVFGLQWLRKAVLRSTGRKAKHDEDAIYAEQVAELSEGPAPGGWDGTGFAVAYKGVFLEGLEVVIIVLTLGSSAHRLAVAATSAVIAALVVVAVGLVLARQLSSVPENAMKMVVGVMLVSFGTVWTGEGIGVHWPNPDLSIVVMVAFFAVVAWVAVTVLTPGPAPSSTPPDGRVSRG
jgi:Ca2+/H+ antiporter, TMEM165/GDT1 family